MHVMIVLLTQCTFVNFCSLSTKTCRVTSMPGVVNLPTFLATSLFVFVSLSLSSLNLSLRAFNLPGLSPPFPRISLPLFLIVPSQLSSPRLTFNHRAALDRSHDHQNRLSGRQKRHPVASEEFWELQVGGFIEGGGFGNSWHAGCLAKKYVISRDILLKLTLRLRWQRRVGG